MIEKTEKQFIKAIGKKIRNKRLSKNLSQAMLSYDADIQKSQVGRIERGEINTSIGMLFKICKALSMEVKDLFE